MATTAALTCPVSAGQAAATSAEPGQSRPPRPYLHRIPRRPISLDASRRRDYILPGKIVRAPYRPSSPHRNGSADCHTMFVSPAAIHGG